MLANRKLNKEGVGLGLAVSKNIAIALAGDITVKSQQNKGSKFTLSLPSTSIPDPIIKSSSRIDSKF